MYNLCEYINISILTISIFNFLLYVKATGIESDSSAFNNELTYSHIWLDLFLLYNKPNFFYNNIYQ